MHVSDRKARSFKRECFDSPENIVFYCDSALCDVVTGENSLPEARRYARAALLLRYAVLYPSRLDGNVKVKRLLDNWIGLDAVEMFGTFCSLCERREKSMNVDRVYELFRHETQDRICSKDFAAIETVTRVFLKADGFIPVYSPTSAFLLPFHFAPRSGARAKVVDVRQTELPTWSRYLRELPEIKDDVCIDVRAYDVAQFDGDSLMLPLLMAAWRREGGEQFPQYSILRFYATGSMHGGRLGLVDTAEKLAKVAEVDASLLVQPVVGTPERKGELHIGCACETCRERIARWAEERTVCNPVYARKRMPLFDKLVRSVKGQEWESVRKALINLTKRFDKDLDPVAYLQGLMIRSSAACHAGDTNEAVRLNAMAEQFAGTRPEFEADVLRLRIEQIVHRQDNEEFDGIERFSDGLEKAINEYAGRIKENRIVRDLQMRYHGSMGQALAAMAVSGRYEGPVESIKRHCDTAYDMATSLYRDAKGEGFTREDRMDALRNVVQDANYKVMWSALLDFTSLEDNAQNAARKADLFQEFDRGEDVDGSEQRIINDGYRERFRLMGWYRELLKGNPIDELRGNIDESVFDDDKLRVNDWLCALGKKYIGAFEAAWKNIQKAALHFKHAREILDRKDHTTGVIGMIHMTVLAETFRSLRNTPSSDQAEDARACALALLDKPENARWHAEAWRKYLTSPYDEPFPALTYWY